MIAYSIHVAMGPLAMAAANYVGLSPSERLWCLIMC